MAATTSLIIRLSVNPLSTGLPLSNWPQVISESVFLDPEPMYSQLAATSATSAAISSGNYLIQQVLRQSSQSTSEGKPEKIKYDPVSPNTVNKVVFVQ